jgi:hypothetical protein
LAGVTAHLMREHDRLPPLPEAIPGKPGSVGGLESDLGGFRDARVARDLGRGRPRDAEGGESDCDDRREPKHVPQFQHVDLDLSKMTCR